MASENREAAGAEEKPNRTDRKAAAIRRAAYSCFARHGYHGTTVDHICAEANISKGAFYWHFESKQAVFLGILNTWADEVEEELTKQFATALGGPDVYAALTQALQREGHRVRAIMPVWLEFLAQAGRDPEMLKVIAEFHRRIRDVIVQLLTPSIGTQVELPDLRLLANLALGGFLGLVSLQLVDPATNFDEHAERIMASVRRFVTLLPHG